ncbi:uncharacterized protein CANTADRAFT_298870 [Suhomyces tanzawaensis NRRL Y-17324]|uniref:Uncharacterized protein n=1 Tax=Suhomyces tanzawaensis NRRL Y-17324 TaxID=984487 RepID=A0A1E4SF83_9ASCO|nr:uncharacterized protein CANTADRAFT_298870 [Suhomyces tanzawaensis NRRL Y-17324]ODV78184.1 hypothetical protein CANTADRAFT_298870 [Suhomyces tanzawaensis NRRL Y-17324]
MASASDPPPPGGSHKCPTAAPPPRRNQSRTSPECIAGCDPPDALPRANCWPPRAVPPQPTRPVVASTTPVAHHPPLKTSTPAPTLSSPTHHWLSSNH